MPTSKEIREALDTIQALLQGPLPGPRLRNEQLQQVYRTLKKLQPDHQWVKKLNGPAALDSDEEGDDLDLPFLDRG